MLKIGDIIHDRIINEKINKGFFQIFLLPEKNVYCGCNSRLLKKRIFLIIFVIMYFACCQSMDYIFNVI